jgi:hypothetical protein
MSEGLESGIGYLFAGLIVIFASVIPFDCAEAANSYYYCRTSQGLKYTDFALTITPTTVVLQPYTSPESPGTRIYHGKIAQVYGNGNILVDFETYSKIHYLSSYPAILFTGSLFAKAASGMARVFTSSNPANDSIMSCEIKKIFYVQ